MHDNNVTIIFTYFAGFHLLQFDRGFGFK